MEVTQLIDNILRDVTLQTNEGYPDFTLDTHRKILFAVLNEHGFSGDDANEVISTLTEDTDNFVTNMTDILNKALGKSPTGVLVNTYDKLSVSSKKTFQQMFRSLSMEKFVSSYSKIYGAFPSMFSITKGGDSSVGDMGKGESLIISMVKDSTSGGSKEKDIKVGGGYYEVKQLDSSNKGIRIGGKEGNLANSPAMAKMESIVRLINESGVMDSGTQFSKDLNERLKPDSITRILSRDKINPKQLQQLYDTLQYLKESLSKVTKTPMSIISVDDDTEYSVSEKDANKIEANKKVTIEVGPEVGSADEEGLFKKLAKHDYVKNPKHLPEDIFEMSHKYFSHLKGLVVFDKSGKSVWLFKSPIANGLKIFPYNITQGMWKMRMSEGNEEQIFKDMK